MSMYTSMSKRALGMLLAVLAVLAGSVAAAPAGVLDDEKASGVQGGLVVHLGCGDGKDTVKMLLDGRYLVQGLDADAANVLAARENMLAAGVAGQATAVQFDGAHLPYADNLVNLVVDSTGGKVPQAEIMRVLAPGGVYMAGGKRVVKPWPTDIDQWTHYLHGPDNNAVARDEKVGVPRSIQWVSEPKFGRSHEQLASMSAAVTANGRMFFIADEAPVAFIRFDGSWELIARDAFNGKLLWKRSIPVWVDPLRHFRSGPAHLPRRLVAVGDEVYVTMGLAGPVMALDAASGKTLRTYQGTERTEEIIAAGGVLYLVAGTSEVDRRGGGLHMRGEPRPAKFRHVLAVDAASGKQLWMRDFSKENVLPVTLAVHGGHVYFQTAVSVVCLDATSGKGVWEVPRKSLERRMGFSAPTMVVTDDVVLLADRDPGAKEDLEPSSGALEWGVNGWGEKGFSRLGTSTLCAYNASDGKQLWSAPCKEGYNSPVDVFVIDGVVWVGTNWVGLDLHTGKPVKQMNAAAPRVGMAHHRCYRDKATDRFILTGRSGIELLSLDNDKWLSNNSWIRGTCQYGIMPANGLLYAPPDACACFLTVKVQGFFAASTRQEASPAMPTPAKEVLVKGPLYGKTLSNASGQASADWPMYRHDAARSGSATSAAPDSLATRWSAALGGKLTQPAVAGGKVYVASIDTHTVYALAADTGKQVWHYVAGGRVDSTPTVYKGMVIFGSADGWVYCLGASDGQLVWRFRAAPADRMVCAYDQVESTWPVHGSVLVQNDTLYVAAGRNSYIDGGIALYRIEPATGKQLSRTVLCHVDPKTDEQLTSESRFNMEGTGSDILTGDGQNVYLKYFGFDREGNRAKEAAPHLFAIAGLLGEDWFVRSYWIVGEGMPGAGWSGWANAAGKFPAGRILSFTDDTVYGYGRVKVAGGAAGHQNDAYHLFAEPRSKGPIKSALDNANARRANAAKKAKGRKSARPTKPACTWEDDKSIITRAMALCGDRLVIAGPPDLGKRAPGLLAFENEKEALAGFEGQRGVLLRVVSATDGKKLAETKLPAMPVFDGLSAADGCVFISLKNGDVICLGK